MKNWYKGFIKLTIQILLLAISMIVLSFITETEFWGKYFTYTCHADSLEHGCTAGGSKHYDNEAHLNYRGIVYIITGVVLFIITVIKIIMSHDEKDFKK